jgi:acid phosphatase (class A)
MNMNMNMNMNMGAPGSSVGSAITRVRFNTQDYRKYLLPNGANPVEPVIPAATLAMRFPAYWDADLRSYEYLNEFLRAHPNWRAQLDAFIAGLVGAAVFDLVPPHRLPNADLTNEVLQMLDRAPDREDRFAEIIDQHEAEGAIGYFLGMLMADPARMPATNLLIRAARRIGEHIVMCLKGEFRCPRPSQLCSAIVPMIDPPATPSFPSGHSLQARLIALCLQSAGPAGVPLHHLDDLAQRLGENRIIAGLHYPKDHRVARRVADWCHGLLMALPAPPAPPLGADPLPSFNQLVAAAQVELAHQSEPRP